MADSPAIKAAAAAIANARIGRRGAPPIVNVLDALPNRLRDEVMEDADAALKAAAAVRLAERSPKGSTEREDAIRLADHVLDRVNGDPDDDLAVLSRQLLRARETLLALRDRDVRNGSLPNWYRRRIDWALDGRSEITAESVGDGPMESPGKLGKGE